MSILYVYLFVFMASFILQSNDFQFGNVIFVENIGKQM